MPAMERQLTRRRLGPGAVRAPPAELPSPDIGPPADERSQTKKSIGRQPPPALTTGRASRRAVARRRTANPPLEHAA
ncbi:jg9755, partial [Pararge aegeria aegeria]